MDCRWATPDKSKELVYVRDCYRYSGRGSSGFSMHYTEKQCGRTPKFGGYCFQHKKCSAPGCTRRPSFNNKTYCWDHSSK